jgi:hypothetical protein
MIHSINFKEKVEHVTHYPQGEGKIREPVIKRLIISPDLEQRKKKREYRSIPSYMQEHGKVERAGERVDARSFGRIFSAIFQAHTILSKLGK